ncbi:20444_t:CDS:2, partial [Gigaspora margarita]
ALGRITLDEEAEKAPDYAQGIDKIIVKVLCGANITLALSVDGQLYISSIFKDQEGILGILPKKKFEQIFSKYIPAFKFKISDIAVGENHVIFLTTEGFLYTFGSGDYYQLGRKVSKRYKKNRLNPKKLSTGDFHSIAVDKEGNGYTWKYSDTFALGNVNRNDEYEPFKLKIPSIKFGDGGSQYTILLTYPKELE